jgi:hypothetical protein
MTRESTIPSAPNVDRMYECPAHFHREDATMPDFDIAPDGRYLGGDVPYGYALWGEFLVEVPAALDACVTMIRMTRLGHDYAAIAEAAELQHGVRPTRAQYDGLIASVRRRYGPL